MINKRQENTEGKKSYIHSIPIQEQKSEPNTFAISTVK